MKKYEKFIFSILKLIAINFLLILAFAGFFSNSLYVKSPVYALYGAILITLYNKFVKPFLIMISIIPIAITLGIFIIVINAFIVLLVSNILAPNFEVSSFWSALGLALFISLSNGIISKNIIIIKK